jgi:hypothetical protein
MKRYLLLFFLFVNITSSAQRNAARADSFAKYSYRIFGMKSINDKKYISAGGTGFFIKDKGRLFFITAMHVVSGCEDDSTKDRNFPDTLYIIEKEPGKDASLFYPLPTKQLIKIPCNTMKESGDYMVFPIPDSQMQNVYSVERFIQPPFKKLQTLSVWGYPANKSVKKEELDFTDPSPILLNLAGNEFVRMAGSNKRIDSLRYFVIADIKTDGLAGYSGSPVFLKDKESKKWRVAGIFVATTVDPKRHKKFIVITKIDFVINVITKFPQ